MDVREFLERAELERKSDYLEVAEVEVNGERYRKVQLFAGTGKMRRKRKVQPRNQPMGEDLKIARAYVRRNGRLEVIFVAVPSVCAEEILNRLKRGKFDGELLAFEGFSPDGKRVPENGRLSDGRRKQV